MNAFDFDNCKGVLPLRVKLFVCAIGLLCIAFGKLLLSVKTYEQIRRLEPIIQHRENKLNKEFPEAEKI